MMNSDFGLGVYSVPEAAKLIGMSGQTLRRWLLGYDHLDQGRRFSHESLWKTQYPLSEEGLFLGFRDLVEARIVHALRLQHIPLQSVRRCLELAREIANDEHPFSTTYFKTDGKTIFLERDSGSSNPIFIDLRKRQHVFKSVVEPSLTGLEFGPNVAERWWLLSGKRTIVADPNRSFGQPIVASNGVTTARLAQTFLAEGSEHRVAKLFEMRIQEVKDALAFESQSAGTTLH